MQPVTPETRTSVECAANPRIAAARVSFIAAAISFVSLLALHVLGPELNPISRMVSEYALGDFGEVLALMFVAMGAGCFALAVALKPEITTLVGKIGLLLLVPAGIGLAMAALFDVQHALHGAAALIGIPSMTIAPLLISVSLKRNPAWAYRRPKALLLLANVVWISLIVMVATLFMSFAWNDGEMGPIWAGIPNRALMFAFAAWLMLTSRPLQVDL